MSFLDVLAVGQPEVRTGDGGLDVALDFLVRAALVALEGEDVWRAHPKRVSESISKVHLWSLQAPWV
jgi:hypothetical protein